MWEEFDKEIVDKCSQGVDENSINQDELWDEIAIGSCNRVVGKGNIVRQMSSSIYKSRLGSSKSTKQLCNRVKELEEELARPHAEADDRLQASDNQLQAESACRKLFESSLLAALRGQGTPHEIAITASYLRKEFEMKDLGKTRFCLGIQIEHLPTRIFIHQLAYTEKVLKRFNMDKPYPLSTPMVVRTFDVQRDPIRPPSEEDEIFGSETPYLSVISALIYHANNTIPDIAFVVNLLAKYSSTPT
ncbi:uncharacterized protein LOC120270287 [Dioscorea cayenensis subsp. rotundata]|uniref:Uncharacterized protein LOC120270287 n=1 Tax=Dioscorea cayennensis subsp. rotundata TaxID=55577 RepID=A0AB40C0H5_DIOCR|nr:uncharacterized protein LOC120270287 [Dioscorea cayenensis subsp. rotundata]